VVKVAKEEGYVEVLTGDGILRLWEVQVEGEKRTMAANVIRSVRSTLGLSVTDIWERLRALEEQVASLLQAQASYAFPPIPFGRRYEQAHGSSLNAPSLR
jgi:hypothetical protein